MNKAKPKTIVPQTFTSTVYLADGRCFEIEERLPADVIEAEARKVGAVKVVLENGTEIYLNAKD